MLDRDLVDRRLDIQTPVLEQEDLLPVGELTDRHLQVDSADKPSHRILRQPDGARNLLRLAFGSFGSHAAGNPTRACKTKVPVCQVAFWLNGRGIGLGLWERADALAYVQGLLRERHVAGGGAQAPTAACATGLARAQALEWLVKALFDEACAGALVFVVLASQALGIVPGNVVTLEAHGDVQDRNPLPDVPSCTLHAATFLNLSATSALLPGTAAREIIVMAMAHKVANRHFPRRALDLALRKRGKLPGGPLKPIKPINRVPTQVTCEFPSQLKINRPPSASQLFFVLCVLCFWSSRLPHALLALQKQAFGSGRRIGTNLPCSGRTFFQFGIQDSLSKQAVKQHQKQDLLSASSETFGHCTPPGQEALTSLSVHSNPSFCPEEALLWASHTLGHGKTPQDASSDPC